MKVRTLTAIIALIVFLPILLKGGLVLMIFANILALIALKELLNMNMIKFVSVPGLISAVGLIIIMLPQHAGPWVQVIQLKSLIAMSFIVLSYTVLSKNRFSFMDAAFCLMSVAYVGIGFMFFYETRSEGLHYILYAFLIVWLTDTGAYLFGKMMGKHKLWPVISPNKTIEGFIGGLLTPSIYYFLLQLFLNWPVLTVIQILQINLRITCILVLNSSVHSFPRLLNHHIYTSNKITYHNSLS